MNNLLNCLSNFLIKPMLMYGSGVWGLIAERNTVERVPFFAIKKRLLNVSPRMSNLLVYKDTG